MKLIRPHTARLLATVILLGLSAGALHAQTSITWNQTTAGSYDWNTAGNWNGGNVPDTTGESAVFNGAGFGMGAGSYAVSLSSDVSVAGISQQGTGTGNVQLTISGGTITMNNVAGTSNAVISLSNTVGNPNLAISSNLVLADAEAVQLNLFRNMKLAGAITGTSPKLLVGGSTSSNVVFIGAAAHNFAGVLEIGASSGIIATATNTFTGLTGQINFTATGANSNSTLGTVVSGTTTVANAINLNNSSVNFKFNNGGSGSVLDIGGQITNAASGAGQIQLFRAGGDTSTAINVASPTGVGTVRFSGTGYTIGKTLALSTSSSVEFAPATGTQTWSGAITGSGVTTPTVTKSGNGRVVFGGANTYQAQTLVSGGTLTLNGTHIDSAATNGAGYGSTTAGHFQVGAGATLEGTGRIAGNSSSNNSNMVLVQNGAFLGAGDNGIGNLTLDGITISGTGSKVLNMASGSAFSFDLSGNSNSADKVSLWNYVPGDVSFNSNAINLTSVGAHAAGSYSVTLFDFYSDSGTSLVASSIASGLTIGTLTSGDAGFNLTNASLNFGANSITLNYDIAAVPEPSTCALLGAPLLGFVANRRRAPRR